MSGLIEQRTPAIEAMLEHARDQVARQRAAFAATVEEGLADARHHLPAEDRRRFDACIDHVLGRRQIYANQCAGLHFPFLPAEEFFERRHFPWLDEIEAKTGLIRAELEALLAADRSSILPYVAMEPGTPANKWSPLDRSLDWGALHLWKDGRRDEAACALAPRTAAAVEALPLVDLPGRTPTIFFSLLRPGTHLPPHTGVSNARTIIHLPLIVPPGCAFRVGGQTREWEEGRAWAFDDTIEHEAWNRSDKVRAILIFDVWNPYIEEAERDLLRHFFAIAGAGGHGEDAAIGIG
jgi:aspartyl/asparaginyl beta-hydroxylase (cupin superfamily)